MKIKPTWIVQDNLRQVNDGVDTLLSALDDMGAPVELVKVIPFAEELEPIKAQDPVIFFGSTSLRELALKANRSPGVWFDPVNFYYPRLIRKWGGNLLNADSTLTSVGSFLHGLNFGDWDKNEPLFLRPSGDGKEVTGGVKTATKWAHELRSSMGTRYGCTSDTSIQLAAPKDVLMEWRVFLIGDAPPIGCRTRVGGRLSLHHDISVDVLEFASRMRDIYSPEPVFVLDVCSVIENGNPVYKIVEPNCFNCAGLYVADVKAIVSAVHEYVATR